MTKENQQKKIRSKKVKIIQETDLKNDKSIEKDSNGGAHFLLHISSDTENLQKKAELTKKKNGEAKSITNLTNKKTLTNNEATKNEIINNEVTKNEITNNEVTKTDNKTDKNISKTKYPVYNFSTATTKRSQKITRKIWNLLEWVAVSALIFTIIFFIINFSSYSMLLKNKLEKLYGTFELDPYIEKIIDTKEVKQEALPIIAEEIQFKTQIPPLNIDVSPPDDRIIIPRVNKNVPIVNISSENLIKKDWNALENDIQDALRDGVVHYPGTAQAGSKGNVVITGHSSYFPWDSGRFKDVFALLHEVVVGDTIIVFHDQHKFVYEVYEKKVVMPDQVDILTQEGEERLTLITCTPIGTNLKRLIILARPI